MLRKLARARMAFWGRRSLEGGEVALGPSTPAPVLVLSAWTGKGTTSSWDLD